MSQIRFSDYSISVVAKLAPSQTPPDGPRVWKDRQNRWFVECPESTEAGVFICPDELLPAAELRIQAQEMVWNGGAMVFTDINGRPLQCYATKKKDGHRGLFSVPIGKGMVMIIAGSDESVYIAEIRGATHSRAQLGIVRNFPFGEEVGYLKDVPSHYQVAAKRAVEVAKRPRGGIIFGAPPVSRKLPAQPAKK